MIKNLTVRFRFRVNAEVVRRASYDFSETTEAKQPEDHWMVRDGLHDHWVHTVVEIPEGEDSRDYIEDRLVALASSLEKQYFARREPTGNWKPNPRLDF